MIHENKSGIIFVGLCTILCQKLIYENDGYYENEKFFFHTSGDDRTKLYCVV